MKLQSRREHGKILVRDPQLYGKTLKGVCKQMSERLITHQLHVSVGKGVGGSVYPTQIDEDVLGNKHFKKGNEKLKVFLQNLGLH